MKQHHMQNYLVKEKPHIMLISETHLNGKYQPNFIDYTLIRSDRTKNGGGTAILIRDNISFETLQPPNNCRIETTIIKVKINENRHITFIAAYIPDQSLKYEDIEQLMGKYGPNNVILGADLNTKHVSWNNHRNNPNGIVLANWATDNMRRYYVDFPNEPTFLRDGRAPSILDCFISSANITGIDHDTIMTKDFLSDHRAIELDLIFEGEIEITEPQTIWNWSKCNWDGFNTQIDCELKNLAIPENRNIDKNQIDELVGKIESIFESTVSTHCPRIKIHHSKLINLSERSLALVKRKNKLRRRLFSNRNSANFFAIGKSIRNELKLLNGMILNSIAEDYRSHFVAKIQDLDTKNHNLFRDIQKISNYKNKENLPNVMTNNDETESYSSDKSKADAFAEQFASTNNIRFDEEENDSTFQAEVDSEIENWYEQNEKSAVIEFSDEIWASDPYQKIEYDENDPSIKFLNCNKLKEIIKSRNNKKSTGADGITTRMLKVLSPVSLLILTILFNHIINIGYYPIKWRHGIIIPVPKKGKPKNKISSYRPIQLLSNLSKLLEKHISDTILNYNEKYNLFPKQQFAYQKGKSTWHPLVSLSHTIANNLNGEEKTPTFMITLDFEKAFDLLWIKGLIWKCLNAFNFSNATSKILYSFMQSRTFQASVKNSNSVLKNVDIGSPQGSSISAFAFILYTSDFPEPKGEFMKTLRYSDDIAIVVSDKNVYRAEKNINEYIQTVADYTEKFRMKLNKTKCELLVVLGQWKDIGASVRNKIKKIDIKIGDHQLEAKREIRYLGILFNKQFHFRTQVDQQIKRAHSAFSACNNLFRNKMMNVRVKSLLYKSLIRSILCYGFAAWNNINSFNMEKIRRVERKILRACTGLYRQKNSIRFVNSAEVYKKAQCNRFDVFVNDNQIRFFDRIIENKDEFMFEVTQCENFEIAQNNYYKTPSFMYEMSKRGLLIEESKFLYYNKNRRGETAYVTAQ